MADIDNMSDEGKWNNFRRQRRNFFLITAFMFALAFTDSDISKVSLLGNEISSGDPKKIAYLLWLTFFYFVLRYYYALKEINDHMVQTTFQEILMKLISKASFKDAPEINLQTITNQNLAPMLADNESVDDYDVSMHIHAPTSDSRNDNIWTIKTRWSVHDKNKQTGQINELKTDAIYTTVDYNKIKWKKFKAWFKTMATKYYFTEYYLPYVFVSIALIYSICVGKFIF